MITWIRIASIFMFLAVGFGSFGAHALHSRIGDYFFGVYRTAMLYHFIHALGLFVVAWLSTISKDFRIRLAGFLMVAGIIIFSGSLYALSLTGIRWVGVLTPIGGLCFLAAWICLFLAKL